MRKETLKKADFDLFVEDFSAKWSGMAGRLRSLEAALTALDKREQKGYIGNSPIVPGTVPAEPLSKETEEMNKTLAACLTALSLGIICDAQAAEASTPLPPLVVDAPPARSSDMWVKYPKFFERFKEVWTACPLELELKRGVEIAQWYNENTALYKRMISTCRADRAHSPNRSWPPTPTAAKMLKERFFSQKCERGACRWVQTK